MRIRVSSNFSESILKSLEVKCHTLKHMSKQICFHKKYQIQCRDMQKTLTWIARHLVHSEQPLVKECHSTTFQSMNLRTELAIWVTVGHLQMWLQKERNSIRCRRRVQDPREYLYAGIQERIKSRRVKIQSIKAALCSSNQISQALHRLKWIDHLNQPHNYTTLCCKSKRKHMKAKWKISKMLNKELTSILTIDCYLNCNVVFA